MSDIDRTLAAVALEQLRRGRTRDLHPAWAQLSTARCHGAYEQRSRQVRLRGSLRHPITDPARTVLDLARYVRGTNLRNAIEDARRLELLDWSDLVECLAAHARRGRRGISRLRQAIAMGAANGGITDTDSELIALSVLREHGFPEPTLQHRVYASDGRLVAEVDFAYLDRRISIEIDGDIHLLPEVKVKDEARDHELRTRYGFTVRRVWWQIPVYQPREFVAIVRDTLRTA